MKNLLTNMRLLLGFNDKLYGLALGNYFCDVKRKDDELDALYMLILQKLVYPVGQKDVERIVRGNSDERSLMHPFQKLNAEIQKHQNDEVFLELKLLHRSENYMSDFLECNNLWVETDPFGGDELASKDNLDEREILYSPIIKLSLKGKKAIQKRFSGSIPPASQK